MLSPLRQARVLKGLTLYDIRARTGVSVSKLSLIERGIEQATEAEKARLCRALKLKCEEAFPAGTLQPNGGS